MRKWASTKITLEGHCDSRGTTEYNLALGERRAQPRQRLPGQPWHRRGPHPDDQQGQGIALLHGRGRVVLVTEPAGTLRHHREVTEHE